MICIIAAELFRLASTISLDWCALLLPFTTILFTVKEICGNVDKELKAKRKALTDALGHDVQADFWLVRPYIYMHT